MRFFKGLGLFIFSLIVFTLSVVMILIGLEVVKLEAVASLIPYCFGSQTASIITYSVCGVLVVLSLICLFGKSNKAKKKEEQDKGILLANSDGQLLITKQTIENIVSGVVANTNTIYDARSSVMIDNANNVSVKVYATVVEGALIKDVSSKLQTDIKNAIKSATDLEVTTVDVAISNMNGNGQYAPAAPVVTEPVVEQPVVEEPTYVEPAPVPVIDGTTDGDKFQVLTTSYNGDASLGQIIVGKDWIGQELNIIYRQRKTAEVYTITNEFRDFHVNILAPLRKKDGTVEWHLYENAFMTTHANNISRSDETTIELQFTIAADENGVRKKIAKITEN